MNLKIGFWCLEHQFCVPRTKIGVPRTKIGVPLTKIGVRTKTGVPRTKIGNSSFNFIKFLWWSNYIPHNLLTRCVLHNYDIIAPQMAGQM